MNTTALHILVVDDEPPIRRFLQTSLASQHYKVTEAADGALALEMLRAGSFEEAEEICKSDPLHAAGLRSYTIQKWRVNEGSMTFTVNFSDQTAVIS